MGPTTYIQQAEHFLENWANEIPAAEALTWLTLFHFRNKARLNNGKQWPEWFEVSNGTLAAAMHKDSRNLYKLKQNLKNRGLLDYKQEKKGKPTQYKIILPDSVKTTVTVENTHNPRKNNGRCCVKPTVRKYATLEPGSLATQGTAAPLRGEENKESKRARKSTPPTLDEVRAYVKEKGLPIDAAAFYEYYEAGNWHDGNGKPVKSWKQKALTWARHERDNAPKGTSLPPLSVEEQENLAREREARQLAMLEAMEK